MSLELIVIEQARIVVLAILHTARSPSFWVEHEQSFKRGAG